MTTYEWTPLTEEERWRNAGLGGLLDAAVAGDKLAQLLVKRLRAADDAMRPEVERVKAEIAKEWLEHGTSMGGLSLLVGEVKK